jgi:iron complex outermembrane receptor protein
MVLRADRLVDRRRVQQAPEGHHHQPVYNYHLRIHDGKVLRLQRHGPVNGARGHARGIEIAYQQYFDKLPGWLSGFGVQANYTYVDSKRELYNPVHSRLLLGQTTAAATST